MPSKTSYLIALFILFCSFSSFSQKLDCKKFKNGEFYYPGLPNKLTVRKNNIQGSYDNGSLKVMWNVVWKSECEYDIICTKVYDKTLPVEIGDKIAVKIVSTKKKCYYSELTVFNKSFPNGMVLPDGPHELCFEKDQKK
jgi:hypothetical protein